jgi:molybdopterin-containing oxidoreductase family membrane subunit
MSHTKVEGSLPVEFEGVLRWDNRLIIATVILVMVLLAAVYTYGGQFARGLGITGLNRPAFWGLYIVNFVFFVGLSAGGIIIASLVHGFGFRQFYSVARIAELMTICCLFMAMGFIFLDLGRPDRLLYIILHPHPRSPLSWDVTVVNLYLLISLTYGYFGTRADLARVMRYKPEYAWLYRLMALGYTDLSPKALARDRAILKGLSFVGLVGAIGLHTITAWILGLTKARPGWFGPMIAPLFIVSATVSALALLVFAVVALRRLLHLRIEDEVIRKLGIMLACSIPALGYFLFAEMLTVFYSAEPSALHVFRTMMYGYHAPVFWGNLVFGLLFPFLLLSVILGRVPVRWVMAIGLALLPPFAALAAVWNFPVPFGDILGIELPAWQAYAGLWLLGLLLLSLCASGRLGLDLRIGLSGLLVVLGVLAERWNIVVPSLVGHSYVAYPEASYHPSLPEITLASGVYAMGLLFFIACIFLLPLVESEEEEA